MARHTRRVVWVTAAMLVVALGVDYAVVESKERRLTLAVSELGGRIGSLPAWPLGTEYQISFQRPLNRNQLKIANRMRGWVGIAFRNCELSETERSNAREALPNCHLFVDRNGEMVPLDRR